MIFSCDVNWILAKVMNIMMESYVKKRKILVIQHFFDLMDQFVPEWLVAWPSL